MKFFYNAEYVAMARRALMLPHYVGEADSISNAYHSLMLGLDGFNESDLDPDASHHLSKIREIMNLDDMQQPTGRALARAERLTPDQKMELSKAVDELATWFQQKAWEEGLADG